MKSYLLLISLFLCCCSFAQKDNTNRKDSFRILNPKYFYSDLSVDKNRSAVPASLPFDSICFVDVRYDTTFIALNWRPRYSNHVYKSKYDVKGGLEQGFTHYFNSYYTPSPKRALSLFAM